MLLVLWLLLDWLIFHVHFREPGQTHKEDIHTGALAAATGGFTTVVMMANTIQPSQTWKLCKKFSSQLPKKRSMSRQLRPLLKILMGKTLTDFKALLEAGAVGFSDDGIPLESSKVLKEALENAKKTWDLCLSS